MAAENPQIFVFPTLAELVQEPQDLDDAMEFRFRLPLSFRPLAPVARYPETRGEISAEGLAEWLKSPEYKRACDEFTGYPERSLLKPPERALLYHLVRTLKPEHVVEIGTYYAGGTEVFARALWENGRGIIHTADPFGRVRCPSLIARWSPELRKLVRFYPQNSMQVLTELGDQGLRFDLVLVDGNHDLEFALFDLQAAARFMNPGGVVIMDDSNQSGPFWASKLFLRQNPAWTEIGQALSLAESDDPFGPLPTIVPETKFVMLKAPERIMVGEVPWTTGDRPAADSRIDAIELAVAPGQRGTLFGRVFLRSFPDGVRPEQLAGQFRVELCGEGHVIAPLERPLCSIYSGANRPRQTVEVVLLWRPLGSHQPLELTALPGSCRMVNRMVA